MIHVKVETMSSSPLSGKRAQRPVDMSADFGLDLVRIAHVGRTFISGLEVSSTFGTTMNAVMSAENANINELAESTAFRADETPVIRDTTTKTFSGTRNSAESCKDGTT